MRILIALLLLFEACSSGQKKQSPTETNSEYAEPSQSYSQGETSWIGTINHKIPILLHYTPKGKVLVGEVIYLNTKDKKPIKVIGTLEEDSSYRLLEFAPDGNITGIISGKPNQKIFTGDWFSPKTRKEFQLNLTLKDTLLHLESIEQDTNSIYGDYHYQYSDEGSQGHLTFTKLNDKRVAFDIISVTDSPAHNIAEIPTDTIAITGNSFNYKMPETDSCEFKVTFFNGFAMVEYTKGYCSGQFGLNASIDGIFLKVKKK